MKKKQRLVGFSQFLIFFATVAVPVTVCTLVFLADVQLPREVIAASAVKTLIAVVVLSAFFAMIDALRRRYTVELPVKSILEATERITNGDFNVQIPLNSASGRRDEFVIIAENINKMAKELSGIESLRSDFVSNVSHEMKTPLAVIRSGCTMLSRPGLSEETRLELAHSMEQTCISMSEMITNVLRLNKLESQSIYPEAGRYDLGEQLCECVLGFENVWEQKNIDIETDIDEGVEIIADEQLLALVWNNLISNALKFTEPGGKVGIFLKKEGEYATVTVSDTGCGISANVGKHIFEKFYQGDTSHSSQGNGLGLALVKRIADITGADLSVKSRVGEGSSFSVRIKAADPKFNDSQTFSKQFDNKTKI